MCKELGGWVKKDCAAGNIILYSQQNWSRHKKENKEIKILQEKDQKADLGRMKMQDWHRRISRIYRKRKKNSMIKEEYKKRLQEITDAQ